jgi:hypothetical protein
MPVTKYNISLNLYVSDTSCCTFNDDALNKKITDTFSWAMHKLIDHDDFKILKKYDELVMDTVDNAEYLHMLDEDDTEFNLGEYVNKNELHESIIENVKYSFSEDGTIMEGTFDPKTATINIIFDVKNASNPSKYSLRSISNDIEYDSLEDGIYEGCYDVGTGFEVYTKVKIDVSSIIDLLKKVNYLKDDERLNITTVDFDMHQGVIDYRKNFDVSEVHEDESEE